MGRDLTEAQAELLRVMGDMPGTLRNDDECRPAWWIEGGGFVRGSVAKAAIAKGYVGLSGHLGGWPGMDCFTRTEAGRAALAEHDTRRRSGGGA